LDAEVARIEMECGCPIGRTKLLAAIESASGVINAVSIATASKRMIGIALAGFDYVIDMQSQRETEPNPNSSMRAVLCCMPPEPPH